jgi:hypothetical protein
MYSRLLFVTVAALGLLNAQSFERRATYKFGGDPNRGKCTIEVVVDGAAEVEIRGDSAVLRNLAGQPPQWRRFECTGPMPANPANFRFAGVDGRGRQTLMRAPGNGGGAVVRIEDKDNGSEGYTFDIFWGGGGGGGYPPAQDDRSRGDNRDNRGYPSDQRGAPDQRYDRGRDDRDQDVYHRGRDEGFRAPDFRQRFFQRIREDLYHVQSVTFPGSGDQYRISRTLQQLDELQDKLARGYYDERELNEVIGAMQRVVADNRLARRDRDILADDLDRLRDFRARHDYYGAR